LGLFVRTQLNNPPSIAWIDSTGRRHALCGAGEVGDQIPPTHMNKFGVLF